MAIVKTMKSNYLIWKKFCGLWGVLFIKVKNLKFPYKGKIKTCHYYLCYVFSTIVYKIHLYIGGGNLI